MAPSTKSKKRTKAPQGRPVSTSAISQPVVEDASTLTALSSFSPNGNHFSFLSLAVDKHRLRVYSTVTGQSVAEHIIDSARVSAVAWGSFDPSEGQNTTSNPEPSPSKKKRRKRDSLVTGDEPQNATIEVVILGLSDGTILLFSPNHGRVLRTLSHPSSTAEVLALAMVENGDKTCTLWASGADGAVRLWNAQKNEILGSWKNDDRIPYTFLAPRPMVEEGRVDVLAAHHSIRLLSTSSDDTGVKKPKELASFTGHASSTRQLQWDASQSPSTRFVSFAEADRILYIWEVPQGPSSEGKAVASIPLDSDSRNFSLSFQQKSPNVTQKQSLLTLSASGKLSVFPIPAELASSTSSKHKLPTLLPRSNLAASSKAASSAKVVNAVFVSGEEGTIRIARLVAGIRPVFDVVRYLDDSGEFIPEVVLQDVRDAAVEEIQPATSAQRYKETPNLAVGSGVELGQDEDMDDLTLRDVDGDLDVDLAELSLGQRLTALSGAPAQPSSESDDEAAPKTSKKKKAKNDDTTSVPANSLTRTLIQALHSSDMRLLETCLAHSDQTLIRNTVRRLPPQLAVPLITACVERLGRGARAGNMKGGGGGASAQRGTGLITWIKTALTVHSGHLMTIPDLVARLSGLHATLTSRLKLQESLLSLNGRLDMVISQIELRSSTAPAPLAPRKSKDTSKAQATQVTRYVEGESEDEDDDEQMDVEVESGDEEGSVEDVELGGSSDEEDEMSEDDEEDADDDDDDESPTMNGFIDDEAEEYSEEDDESD